MNAKIVYKQYEGAKIRLGRDLLSGVIAAYVSYRDPIIKSIIEDADSNGLKIIILDPNGFWGRVKYTININRFIIGIDIPLNLFTPPEDMDESIYFNILYLSLYIISEIFKYPYSWRLIFLSSLNDIYEREGSLDLSTLLNGLNIYRNEATGIEREAYTVLYNIIYSLMYTGGSKGIFSGRDIFNLNSIMDSPCIIDFSPIPYSNAKLLVYIVFLLSILARGNQNHFIQLFNGELYLDRAIFLDLLNLSQFEASTCIQFNRYSVKPLNLFSLSIIDNRLYSGNIYRIRGPEPLDSPARTTHHIYMNGIYIPIRLEEGLEVIEGGYTPTIRDDFKPDKELVRRILEVLKEYGELGIGGIHMYLMDYPREDVYATVEWLWRMGYVKRRSLGRYAKYGISVKGLMYLSGGDDG